MNWYNGNKMCLCMRKSLTALYAMVTDIDE